MIIALWCVSITNLVLLIIIGIVLQDMSFKVEDSTYKSNYCSTRVDNYIGKYHYLLKYLGAEEAQGIIKKKG